MTLQHTSKEAFLSAWPGGYRENFDVYTTTVGLTEEQIVSACLRPFYDAGMDAIDIGCGAGFWIERHLAGHFRSVTGIDLLPSVLLPGGCHYIEVGDCDYSLAAVNDESMGFAWSFGVFCHLPNEASEEYCRAIFRVLKPGGVAVLYFSNTERRGSRIDGDKLTVGWADNDWKRTRSMLKRCGFVNVRECIPGSMDTLAFGEKPFK